MAEDKKVEVEVPVEGQKSRRAFVKTAAQVAVTAPAVGMLLNASTKPAEAALSYTVNPTQAHILDDFTYGNNEEDIDSGASLDDVT
jgi:hypothetical protein